MTFLTLSHLFCRLLLALSFLVFALEGLSITAVASHHGTGGLHQIEWAGAIVVSGMLMFASTWLLFGLRSRVVAVFGLMLYSGQFLWFRAIGLDPSYGLTQLAFSAVLALPLLFLGGGPFAIYRRGWSLSA